MDITPRDMYDAKLVDLIEEAANCDQSDEETTLVLKHLRMFTESCPPKPERALLVEPTTRRGKVAAWLGRVLDNETSRTAIKVAGPLAGVALVAWTTIHKDHVIERQVLAQANQRPY